MCGHAPPRLSRSFLWLGFPMYVRAARNGDSPQRLAGGLARTRADPTGPARSAQLA